MMLPAHQPSLLHCHAALQPVQQARLASETMSRRRVASVLTSLTLFLLVSTSAAQSGLNETPKTDQDPPAATPDGEAPPNQVPDLGPSIEPPDVGPSIEGPSIEPTDIGPGVDVAEETESSGVRYGDPVTKKIKLSMRITPTTQSVRAVNFSIPVPMDWPEQTVEIFREDIPDQIVGARYRVQDNAVRQFVGRAVNIGTRSRMNLAVTYSVTTRAILPPSDTTGFQIPRSVDKEISRHLKKSPLIVVSSSIRRTAKEIASESEAAWDQVSALQDWVKTNIEDTSDPPSGAQSTLRRQSGGLEDRANLFVAFCRSQRIPARLVWVTNSVYAEFYLVDEDGTGHWFPAQLQGDDPLGAVSNPRIIEQKGDNVKIPETKKRQRVVVEYAEATGRASPVVEFDRVLLRN